MIQLNPSIDELIRIIDGARRARHLSMDALGAELGLSGSTLYYHIKHNTLTLQEFLQICEVCGIQVLIRGAKYNNHTVEGR